MMSNEEKIALMEEIMDLDEGELRLESVLSEYEEWDSLSKLTLIAEAKQKFGMVLTTDVIRGFVTVRDVCDYLG
ncbi:MAG: acyl carrier protein [Schwartzia sp. (in: firmicutes)]